MPYPVFLLRDTYLSLDTEVLKCEHDALVYSEVLVSLHLELPGVCSEHLREVVAVCESFLEVREEYHAIVHTGTHSQFE